MSDLGRLYVVHGLQPVLVVADLAAALRSYHGILDLDVDFTVGAPPTYARIVQG